MCSRTGSRKNSWPLPRADADAWRCAVDDKRFWDLIAHCCSPEDSEEEWESQLVSMLASLPPEDIVGFDQTFDHHTNAAYTVDLWGAAYLINGGASDDGFYYFRCWLV